MSKPMIENYIASLEGILALHFGPDGLYQGRDGAMRLAREVGYGLADYDDKEVKDMLGSLYSRLIVRFTFSSRDGVPVNNKEWLEEMRTAIAKKQNDIKGRSVTCG